MYFYHNPSGGGRTIVRGSAIGNNDSYGPGLGKNCQGEGRRGRNGKYTNIKDVGVKDYGERLALP